MRTSDWLSRARRQIPLRHALQLFSLPLLTARLAGYPLGINKRNRIAATDPSARDPELVSVVLEAFRPLAETYFRWDLQGIERVPASGPVLFVGNHNGGLFPTEGALTLLAVWDRFGPERAVYGLAHDVLFDDPLIRDYAGRFGALRASHEGARNAFDAGHSVLVYPGSDLDSCRSWADRKRVELGTRAGFIELALRAQVPIVPVVSAGPQEQWVVLTRGDALARALRTRAWLRTEVFPIVLALPWGLTTGYLPYLPLPAQASLAFGEPVRFEHPPGAADDPAIVEECRREIAVKMQSMLDEMYEGRRPWLGRRRA